MNDKDKPTPEEELWDDKNRQTPAMFHKNCPKPGTAKVTWVTGEEFRCWSCGEAVDSQDIEVPDEPLLMLS